MLKNSKIYSIFSHFMPYIVGFGSGSGFAFLVTLIPKVRDLHTAWIVLITLGIVLLTMAVSYVVFKVIIPKINFNKLYKAHRDRKLDELIGLIDQNQKPEEIKAELKKLVETTRNKKVSIEKMRQANKDAKKTQKAADIFSNAE
ncbi:hypothetical protein LD119_00711 [Mesoplasma sp. JKS002660]|uniref:hypothetical protein n=1 Tax=Mesoplasma whartonense TaxID=2878854 RepID=UPI0020229EAB|nr:hypothetical protein [Mesoplasma sp. JKS002660]MCL8213760.1 hypothetical protein [Mesoplasma sp. JKS002660]